MVLPEFGPTTLGPALDCWAPTLILDGEDSI
jgi:hypothetical protein